jgi:methionyl-tRNA formyltransferase
MQKIGLFLGTRRGLVTLRTLLAHDKRVSDVLILEQHAHEIDNVTQDIIALCEEHGINYNTSKEIRPRDYEPYLREVAVEILFVISWRFLIDSDCFAIPALGIFILHDSLLPKYRGFSPTNWVIINGESETGLSLQYISSGMDEGDLVDQIRVPLDESETACTLNAKLTPLYPKIILDNLDALLARTNNRLPQDHTRATVGCKRTPEDGRIDFARTTGDIVRLIRGLTHPYPGAYCYYRGKRVIIWEAIGLPDSPIYAGRIPGRIVGHADSCTDVLTGDGVLRIKSIGVESSVQPPTEIFTLFGEKLS